MKLKKPWLLIVSFVATFLAAFLGTFFTVGKITSWYTTLNKPFFNPPNWIFSPVWTTLYILMAISLYLVWRHIEDKNSKRKKEEISLAVKVFFVQLVLNALWSIIFFGAENIFGALMLIVSLWLAIAYIISRFARIDKVASYLLYPYLVWVSFASILNLAVWILNK